MLFYDELALVTINLDFIVCGYGGTHHLKCLTNFLLSIFYLMKAKEKLQVLQDESFT